MPKTKVQKFSLYSLLLKILRKELIIWYFFTFLSSFFYYQAVFGLKMWNRQEAPYSLFLETVNIKSSSNLLIYIFFCFFVGSLLTALICNYWENYILELCRKKIRKLILNYSSQNPAKTRQHNREILNNFLGETELFTPVFIQTPHRIYSAIVNIILTLIFLISFEGKDFAIPFIAVVSLIIAFLSFFAYQLQKKIDQKQDKFRQQENLAMEKYLKKQTDPQKVEKLINSNFRKTHLSLKKKTLSYFPNLIIPGLNILFCFIYYYTNHGENWGIKEFTTTYMIATSVQTIFWKVKDIVDNSSKISKIKVYHHSLQKLLSKLKEQQ